MLLKIAWRNLWRNKRRSAIIISSIIVGVVVLMLSEAFQLGMMKQMLNNRIGSHTGHVQVHAPGFRNDPSLKKSMDAGIVQERLANAGIFEHSSERVIQFGLVSSSYNSAGVNIIGVVPDTERRITSIAEAVVEGAYVDDTERGILISTSLAEKLEVGLDDKVVAMASTINGDVGSQLFRVTGLFRTFDSGFDKFHVYIPIDSARKMLGLGNRISEFVALSSHVDSVERDRRVAEAAIGDLYSVETYKELLPLLVFQMEASKELMWILYVLVGCAMIFGIVNTMLMSVFERVQELGVLMSIGMSRSRVFGMVVLESLLLGLVGSALGIGFGYLANLPFINNGLDLSAFSDGLGAIGISTLIYPELTHTAIVNVLSYVPLFSVLAAIYPAIKAIRLKPVEAMRYV